MAAEMGRGGVEVANTDGYGAMMRELEAYRRDWQDTQTLRARITELEQALLAARIDAVAVRENLRWILHLHHDIGKSGGRPTDSEWRAALDEGMALVKAPTPGTALLAAVRDGFEDILRVEPGDGEPRIGGGFWRCAACCRMHSVARDALAALPGGTPTDEGKENA